MSRGYRARLDRCLDALGRMVREERFATDAPRTGVEVELALVDRHLCPAMVNHAVLARSDSEVLTSELGRWNLELNLPPRTLDGASARALERDIVDAVAGAGDHALGVRAVTVGILPTLAPEHLASHRLTDDPRYTALDRALTDARDGPFRVDIAAPDGAEHLVRDIDSIAGGAACSSLQLHLQLGPDELPAYWNAAQAVAGVQVALAANSPFLLGHRLWAETRIPLCAQAMDGRSAELRERGVRPRVWFGDRWATSAQELFEETVRHFDPLLPLVDADRDELADDDPSTVLDDGRTPELTELRRHNGTVWRWNRPVYDVADGVPHLRLENRLLPSSPSATDAVADALFFYGLVRALVDREAPVGERMSFVAAEDNVTAGARHGIDATLSWPGRGDVPVATLVRDELLPAASDGLRAWGVDAEVADHYLAVIEGRCRTRRNGATWQTDTVAELERGGLDRGSALARMLARYVENMATNEPVHTWSTDRELS